MIEEPGQVPGFFFQVPGDAGFETSSPKSVRFRVSALVEQDGRGSLPGI